MPRPATKQEATLRTTDPRINRRLLRVARAAGTETGERVRVDSTVTETHILEPADARLLYDGVRVLTRLLGRARDAFGADVVSSHDHRRAAKRRALEIPRRRGKARKAAAYRKVLGIVRRTRRYVEAALPAVAAAAGADPKWAA